MTERRRARRAAVAGRAEGGVPVELADSAAPLWRDLAELRAHPVLGRFVDGRVRDRLEMGGRAWQLVAARWAMVHGFESSRHPGMVDWHALRAALEGLTFQDGGEPHRGIGVRTSASGR